MVSKKAFTLIFKI